MPPTLKSLRNYRGWRMLGIAGTLGIALTLAATEIVDAFRVSLPALTIALAVLAGGLLGICISGSISAWRVPASVARAEHAARRRT